MRIAKKLIGGMITAVLATIIFGGPPPVLAIMLGTAAAVAVGLIAWTDLSDERAERRRLDAQNRDLVPSSATMGAWTTRQPTQPTREPNRR